MSDVVIRVDKLGKKFTIGHMAGVESNFREVMTRSARNAWRKGLDMLKGRSMVDGDVVEDFWALRGVDFEISRGEVVSVIGHNGAGKSTLLKILSRIAEPTEGSVEIRGRVACLLEVGTGFHPELSGRENIFLNGAILGMSRREVRARFDEIVDFSGVEKFIDTPVKRYSVGMYARLAFAVAAHLETEILFVDEVLSVGDAEFQERCLARMSKVASDGRTVLFVSHNMAAVAALTRRALVFRAGELTFDGPIQAALTHYTDSLRRVTASRNWGKGANTALIGAELIDGAGRPSDRYEPGTPLRLRVVFDTAGMPGMTIDLLLRDNHNLPIAFYSMGIFGRVYLPTKPGRYEVTMTLEPYMLAAGEYFIDLTTAFTSLHDDHKVENAVRFAVETCSPEGAPFNFSQDLGVGNHAIKLMEPLRFTEVQPAPAAADGLKPAAG
ncbi:MAG: ABC transporter ATP-binding protein [Reyranella sp.]|jgi:lipopolysaccharide transport system ATP-binding protein|nr:ABC transporter ATP-binding protein [Reyranella sp.]